MARGRGPHGLAWHECRDRTDVYGDPMEPVNDLLLSKGLLREDQVLDALYRLLLIRSMEGGTLNAIAEGLEAHAQVRKASGGGKGGVDAAQQLLARWTTGPRPAPTGGG